LKLVNRKRQNERILKDLMSKWKKYKTPNKVDLQNANIKSVSIRALKSLTKHFKGI